ncbi:DUF2283 domain-containing protein [Actinoplanes sp. NPDC051346]|uniref:DUF2283 domain-containing protein n=1 Tax=Actinoplanes sp. NPDC051346 TaxID=3155048 RepID=UPI003425BF5F
MIDIDFDETGHLVGIEVLDARAKLAPELVAAAEDITRRGRSQGRTASCPKRDLLLDRRRDC